MENQETPEVTQVIAPESAPEPAPEVGPETGPGSGSGWHQVNVGQLVMGLAFFGLLVIWALVVHGDVPTDDLRWLLPVPWILGGSIGLVAFTVSQRRR